MTFTNFGTICFPVAENLRGARAVGVCLRGAGSSSQTSSISSASSSFSRPTICWLQRVVKSPVFVEHVGDAAGHAGGEVAAGRAETTTRPPVMYSQP